MSKRAVAWLSLALTLACLMVGGFFSMINGPVPSADNSNSPIFNAVVLALLAFAVMGALIVSRQPRHVIGWIFSGTALVSALGGAADGYAQRALLVVPGSLPGGLALAWFARLTEGPVLFSVVSFILLLFPNGRPLSPRWRRIVRLAIVVTAAELFLDAFMPGPLTNTQYENFANPFGIPALAAFGNQLEALLFFLQLALLVLSVVSLVLRYRRSVGEEREQIKWLASAGVFIGLALLAGPVIWFTPALNSTPLWPILFVAAVTVIPVSVGIAILKYRLYDIDLIIRRTLIYSVLTALLALVYFASVLSLQALLRALTGQGQSEIVTVVSTLAIAALFVPLRNHIQSAIDHRFYRRKYDAQQVVAAFAETCRNETDLDTLTAALLCVVDETLQPTQVSLRLMPPMQRKIPS